jgi:glycosyltransferase involved in cell wall biosynthesis
VLELKVSGDALFGHGVVDTAAPVKGSPLDRLAHSVRVLHVAETWTGGVGNYLIALIQQQIDDPRFERITLACSATRTSGVLPFEGHPKVEVVRYTSSRAPWGVLAASRAIQAIARRVKPSLVHLHSTYAGVYGRLFDLECPVLYCAHGWAFTQDVALPVRLAYGVVEAALSRRTHALVHISQDEQRAAAHYHVRAPVERVILHGTRAPRYSSQHPIKVDPSRINLGFVGRFDKQKGMDILLDVFRSAERPDLHLYLVGAFDRDSSKKARELPQQEGVTVVGWVPEQEIDSYIRCFDALVIPSRWEGFGFVAAEAMRNGKPVIISHRGGMPEQVVHGFNGLVFSLATPEALRDIFRSIDKHSLATMGARAREVWLQSFSETRAYRELMNVYAMSLAR